MSASSFTIFLSRLLHRLSKLETTPFVAGKCGHPCYPFHLVLDRGSAMVIAVPLPDALSLTLPDGLCLAFRLIPAGRFWMGQRGEYAAEEPPHPVVIGRPFYLGVYPVTQAQFAAWTGSPAYAAWRASRSQKEEHENGFKDRPEHPAENLTWHEARAYALWLNAISAGQMPQDYRAALPSEAEWEYACRAGTTTDYWSGDGAAALAEVGWFDENSGSETHPVGEKPANPFGLHDMHGNVWEWCRDLWDERPYAKRAADLADPETPVADPEDDRYRVYRGGSWYRTAGLCRSAIRLWGWPGYRIGFLGFRVCLVPGPGDQPGQTGGAERRRQGPEAAET